MAPVDGFRLHRHSVRRALFELKVDIVCADSSQAERRVERADLPLQQDRLVREPRLPKIGTRAAANEFAPRSTPASPSLLSSTATRTNLLATTRTGT